MDGENSAVAGQDREPALDRGRRSVLRALFGSFLAGGFWALGATAALWAAGAARFLMPNTSIQRTGRFRAGFPGDYSRGHVETRYREKYGVWVVCGGDGDRPQIYALRTACTHLGCITLWQEREQKFRCPCHGSGFDRHGRNCEGPAPRPLERCAIRVAEDGQLEIDRGRIFREELGQWDDPACFVSVE